jgi:hypothetical protein
MKNEIVFFEAKDGKVSLPVQLNEETVWLTQAQMAQLFNKDRTVIGRHIRNAIADGEIDAKTMCAKFAHMGKDADQTYWTDVRAYEQFNIVQLVCESTDARYVIRDDGCSGSLAAGFLL